MDGVLFNVVSTIDAVGSISTKRSKLRVSTSFLDFELSKGVLPWHPFKHYSILTSDGPSQQPLFGPLSDLALLVDLQHTTTGYLTPFLTVRLPVGSAAISRSLFKPS